MPKRLRPFLLSGILLILTSALAALLTGEWLYLRNQRAHAVMKESRTAAPIPEVALLPDDFALPALNTYEQIVSRPLFMESRRPGQPPSAEPPPPPPPATPPPITLKLMGILSTPRGKMALIADAKGKYKRLKLKDSLEGWQIDEIRPDRLRMEQSGYKEELPLLKKSPKGAPGARPPMPSPAPAAQPAQPSQAPMQPNRRPMPLPSPGQGPNPPAQTVPGNEDMMEIPDDPVDVQPDEGFDPMGFNSNGG